MTDLDAEVLPDEGEEGGGEVNPPSLSLAMTDLDAEVLPDEGEEGGSKVNPPLPVLNYD
jgi:hypothetical protein